MCAGKPAAAAAAGLLNAWDQSHRLDPAWCIQLAAVAALEWQQDCVSSLLPPAAAPFTQVGVFVEVRQLSASVTQRQLETAVTALCADRRIDGVLVRVLCCRGLGSCSVSWCGRYAGGKRASSGATTCRPGMMS